MTAYFLDSLSGTTAVFNDYQADAAIENSDPTGSVVIDNTAPHIGDLLTLSHTLSDPDGIDANSIEYAWFVNGVEIGEEVITEYLVDVSDLGYVISAMVRYQDNLGQDYEVMSADTDPVLGYAPSLPSTLDVEVEDGDNSITFDAATGTAPITYALSGDDAALFELVGLVATLVTGTFETGTLYDLILTASSDHGADSSQAVSVTVALPDDITVDPFSLGGPVTNADLESVQAATPFTISGATDGADLTITPTNGEYRLDGGELSSVVGTAQNGQLVEFFVTASDEPFTAVVGTLDINGEQGSFYVVTGENAGVTTGVAFFVRDARTEELAVNTTIDVKVVTTQFAGTLLYEADDLAIGSDGYLVIPLTGGELGLQVFISGVLANGKYIAGTTGIIDLADA